MMVLNYTVSLEFENDQPETLKGQIRASSAHTVASRALRATQKAFPRRQWRSVVIVLEKTDQPEVG